MYVHLLFLYVYYIHVGSHRGHKESNSLKLDLQAVVSCCRVKPGSYIRSASSLNHRAISQRPCFPNVCVCDTCDVHVCVREMYACVYACGVA